MDIGFLDKHGDRGEAWRMLLVLSALRSLLAMFIVSAFFTPHCLAESLRLPSSGLSREVIDRVRPRLEAMLTSRGFQWGAPIFMRIIKESKKLEVWLQSEQGYRRYITYYICSYGKHGLGPKIMQGDGRAPEGFYVVGPDQMNPRSQFHLAFNLGYPNAYDRYHGRSGDALMVHGSCMSTGCFAMNDAAMEEIYTLAHAALVNGQPEFAVHIFPFEMNPSRLENFRLSPWHDFWENLLEGYTWFTQHARPPDVQVREGRYVFCDASR